VKTPKAPKKTALELRAEQEQAEQAAKDKRRSAKIEEARKRKQYGSSLLLGAGGETGTGGGPQPRSSGLGTGTY
jgi:hypothetical protein